MSKIDNRSTVEGVVNSSDAVVWVPNLSSNSFPIELDQGTEVLVDSDETIGDFLKICTAFGIEGYCDKAFIDI